MKQHIVKKGGVKATVAMVALVVMSNLASASEWKPEASDRLIKLPANIIEKRVEKDFSVSPMAQRLADIDSQMSDKTTRIAQLQEALQHTSGDARVNIKYEMVQQKSDFLDLLQESHTLRKQAATQKQGVYQDVLQQYRNQHGKAQHPDRLQLQQKQQSALARMEQVMAQVDQNLMHAGFNESSPYADEYAQNVANIDLLREKIATHKANASPMLNGAEVSSEEYLRQLLLNISMEQSLLHQEGVMLEYMARIVALDAQELEYQIAYGEDADFTRTRTVNKAGKAVDLFTL